MNRETIRCIFCQIANEAVFIQENGYYGRKCENCGLVYISPRPSKDDLEDQYASDTRYSFGTSPNFDHELIGKLSHSKRIEADHNIKIIQKYVQKGKLLEIGPGAGFFLGQAKNKGFETYGIEINPHRARYVSESLGIPCETGSIEDSIDKEGVFHVIYHRDAISHFHNPIEVFKNINKRLSNGGLLVFETGNVGDIERKYLSLYSGFQYPGHLFFFGEDNLKELCVRTGFEVIEISRYSILIELLIIKLYSKLLGRKGKQDGSNREIDSDQPSDHIRNSHIRDRLVNAMKAIGLAAKVRLRYLFGCFYTKKGTPMQLVVVARKLKNVI